MVFNKHDIVTWHTPRGDKTCRVLHVYNDNPKILLLTENIDDECGHGNCFHAPQQDCTFVRHGEDITLACRGKGKHKHGSLPLNLIKTTQIREDF